MTSADSRLAAGLEGDPGPGGVLVEEVDHGPAAQGRQLLDLAAGQRWPSARRCRAPAVACRASRSAAESRCFSFTSRALRPELVTSSHAVDLGELDPDRLGAARSAVLADVVGADRQLPVAAVDQDGQLHRAGRPRSRARPARRAPCGRRRARRRRGSPGCPSMPAGGSSVGPSARAPAQPQVVAVEVMSSDADRTSMPLEGRIRAASRRASGAPRVGMPSRTVVAAPAGLLQDLVGDPVDDRCDIGGGQMTLATCGAASGRAACGQATADLLPRLTGRVVKGRRSRRRSPRVLARGDATLPVAAVLPVRAPTSESLRDAGDRT